MGLKRSRTAPVQVCAWCSTAVPPDETARTLVAPPDRRKDGPLPPGFGWVVCGPLCPSLPSGVSVLYRRLGHPWARR